MRSFLFLISNLFVVSSETFSIACGKRADKAEVSELVNCCVLSDLPETFSPETGAAEL